MPNSVTSRHTQSQSDFAVRFFVVSVALFAAAGGIAHGLIRLWRPAEGIGSVVFPPAFGLSTALLLAGSAALHRAVSQVRRERQRRFRRCLLLGLAAGTAFVGVQSFGLYCLVQNQRPAEAALGVNAFVFVLAALHGLHFTVALMFLVFVTLRALVDRYDHEYYFGVVVCANFWHFLGAVWLAILGVLAIASLPAVKQLMTPTEIVSASIDGRVAGGWSVRAKPVVRGPKLYLDSTIQAEQ